MLLHNNMQVVEEKDRNRHELIAADMKNAGQGAADDGSLYRKIVTHINLASTLPDRLVPSRLRFHIVPVESIVKYRRTPSIVILHTAKLRFSIMTPARFDFTTSTQNTVIGCILLESRRIKG